MARSTNCPADVAAADLARRGIGHAALEVATSPRTGKVVGVVSAPAARMVARAVGASSASVPGYIASEVLTSPAVTRAAETGIRSGAGVFARMAASPLARAATGLPGLIGSMVFDSGDRAPGTDTASTARRQLDFAHQYQKDVNAKAGMEVIKGTTVDDILASIRNHRGR